LYLVLIGCLDPVLTKDAITYVQGAMADSAGAASDRGEISGA